jgi:hypothetical protein
MMSTCCSKHVEAWNKYIKKECVKLVINQNAFSLLRGVRRGRQSYRQHSHKTTAPMARTVWCVAISIQYEHLIASTFRTPQALHRINVCYTRLFTLHTEELQKEQNTGTMCWKRIFIQETQRLVLCLGEGIPKKDL